MKKKAGAKTAEVNTAMPYDLLGGRNGKAHWLQGFLVNKAHWLTRLAG